MYAKGKNKLLLLLLLLLLLPGGCGRHPPVNRTTDRRQTLPCRNFVAGGDNQNFSSH